LERKRRAEEAVRAEKERRSRGESSRGWDRDWDHGRERSRRKRRRDDEGEGDSPRSSEKRRRRRRSQSDEGRPSRSSRRRSDEEDKSHHSSRRHPHSDDEQEDKSHRSSRHSKRSHRSRSPRRRSHSPRPSSSTQSSSALPSKMDKYFEESYDPRLDVEPLPLPTIPSTGLISDAEFEGWDAMLELIKLRRQDREDKKALERVGITAKRSKSGAIVADRPDVDTGSSVMDIKYAKKGAVREWDMGKEGF